MIECLQLMRFAYSKGEPFDIGVGITLYQPTIGDIAKFGENEYLSLVSALTSEPFDMPYYLDQMGIDFEKLSRLNFSVFWYRELQRKHQDCYLEI